MSFKYFFRKYKQLFLFIIISAYPFLQSCSPTADERNTNPLPNIILIFIDDLGYGDLGCYGATGYKTPNLDRLAAEGMKFNDFYAPQGVCTASRAGLLTGCYPNRIGLTGAFSPRTKHGINGDEITIAEMLKEQGYATAIFGKWHLGHHQQFLPLQHGFDEFTGLPYSNDMWPVNFDGKPFTDGWKAGYPPLPLIEGNKHIDTIRNLKDQDKLTALYTERAIDFIERHNNEPFFLYLPHSMVHVPLGVSDNFRGKSEQGMFGDVMMELDWSTGEIIKTLEQYGLAENTLIIFTSDNGPWLNFGNHAGSTAGLREGKGTSWEGGQKVPCIMNWPGKIQEGWECSKLATVLDIFPTLASITGGQMPDHRIDGVDLSRLILGDTSANPRKTFLFYYNRNDLEAMRKDYWKLIFPHSFRSYEGVDPGIDGWPGPYARGRSGLELYHLKNDPFEEHNLAEKHPEIVKELSLIADSARIDLGDDLMKMIGKNNRAPGFIYEAETHIDHLGKNAKVDLMTEYSIKYSGGGEIAPTDGKLGVPDIKHPAWQGYHENDLQATIDLGEIKDLSEIRLRMLKEEASWVFPAQGVTYEISKNGFDYKVLGDLSQDQFVEKVEHMIYEAVWQGEKQQARFIRITAKNIGRCPKGHPGEGDKAWLFVDEVIVN